MYYVVSIYCIIGFNSSVWPNGRMTADTRDRSGSEFYKSMGYLIDSDQSHRSHAQTSICLQIHKPGTTAARLSASGERRYFSADG